MFVELVYDKRNVEGLPGAEDTILAELTKRVHGVFPAADEHARLEFDLYEKRRRIEKQGYIYDEELYSLGKYDHLFES
jgi:hypothetical protein